MAIESFRLDPKAVVVLQALCGRKIPELCVQYGISEMEFAQWQAEVMAHLGLAFKPPVSNDDYCFPPYFIQLGVPRNFKNFKLLQRQCDDEEAIKKDILRVLTRTMVTYDGLITVANQVQFCDQNRIEGDFVETGCRQGGCLALMALTHMRQGGARRHFHAFDSFQGLPEPDDRYDDAQYAERDWGMKKEECKGRLRPAIALDSSKDEVEKLLFEEIRYPRELVHIHPGWFQDTVPLMAQKIEKIAILRLDGDLYHSTLVCLEHLVPRVVKGGFVIIDDYGLKGCGKAVKDYFEKNQYHPWLHQVDALVRYFIK